MKSTITQREKNIFDALREKKLNHWEVFKDPDNIGVFKSVINKYPESAHFIYELIQNADDAKASFARFHLFEDCLIFKHNGRPFTITSQGEVPNGDVNAILAIGNSGKDGKNTIGKFGLGFKSVFQFTDEPQIYDDKFRFCINNYIVPSWIEHDHKSRKSGETLFYFPFKTPEEDYKIILNRLNNMISPILFLPNLKQIEWIDECNRGKKYIYKKSVKDIIQKDDINCQLITESNGEQIKKLVVFSRTLNLEKYNNNLSSHKIQIGYYLKNVHGDQYIVDSNQKDLYCFFKTSQTLRMCFVAHAPFETTDNRDKLLPNSKINAFFIDKLIELAADALPILCDVAKNKKFLHLKVKVLDILPWHIIKKKRDYVKHVKGSTKPTPVEEFIFSKFTRVTYSHPLILVENEEYKFAKDIFIVANKDLFKVFSDTKTIQSLLNSDNIGILRPQNSEYVPYLYENLGMNRFTHYLISRKITPEFMSKRSKPWLLKFYKLIKNGDEEECLSDYYYSPIFYTSLNDWRSLYNENTDQKNLFFHLNGYDSSIESDNYTYIHKSYIKDSKFIKAIRELGVTEPTFKDFFEKEILPKYQNNIDDTNYGTPQRLMIDDEIIKNDFKTIINNLYARDIDDYVRSELLQSLKLNYLIKGKDGFYHLCQFLFSSESDLVNQIYLEGNDRFSAIDNSFYDNVPDDKKRRFWGDLDIHDSFWIYEDVYYDGKNKDIKAAKRQDYILSGSKGIDIKNHEQSVFFWDSIIESFSSNKLYTKRGQRHKGYQMEYEYGVVPDYIKWLKNNKWIVTEDGETYFPSQITMEDFHLLYGYSSCEILEEKLKFSIKESLWKIKQEQAKKEAEAEIRIEQDIKEQLFNIFDRNPEKAKSFIQRYTNYERKRVSEDLQRYLGRKILKFYYAEKQRLKLEEGDLLNDAYDFKIGDNIYILMHITDYSLGDDIVPLRLTMKQIQFMQEKSNSIFRIVRMSLKDLGIKHDSIDSIYGKDVNIHKNERLQRACDKKAEKYWRGHNVRQFEDSIAQFSITLKEYIEHVLS